MHTYHTLRLFAGPQANFAYCLRFCCGMCVRAFFLEVVNIEVRGPEHESSKTYPYPRGLAGPDIADFRALGCPGCPKNHSKRWGAKPPTFGKPPKSTISGRPKNHVLKTRVLAGAVGRRVAPGPAPGASGPGPGSRMRPGRLRGLVGPGRGRPGSGQGAPRAASGGSRARSGVSRAQSGSHSAPPGYCKDLLSLCNSRGFAVAAGSLWL
jgi:hypothetical protein